MNLLKTVLTNQYALYFLFFLLMFSYNQLEQLAIQHRISRTLDSFKNLLDKQWKQNIYIWHKVTDEIKPGQFMQHS